jgi:hypothetical protein
MFSSKNNIGLTFQKKKFFRDITKNVIDEIVRFTNLQLDLACDVIYGLTQWFSN